jgi:CheY-like chemotaxis protein
MPRSIIRARVLVVDDNETCRLLETKLLQTWGYRFDEAANGQSALDMLRAAARMGDPYQAALLDMHMPEMDGEELGRRIKADSECRATHLLMLTSLGDRGDSRRFRSAGFEAYLVKPFRQRQLREDRGMVLGAPGHVPAAARSSAAFLPAGPAVALRAGRILVAEDNITNQQVALAFLKRLRLRADVVANGAEALLALQTIPYDLVLMDCQMPEMDGYEAARRIRDPESTVLDRKVPIIAMNAHSMRGDRLTLRPRMTFGVPRELIRHRPGYGRPEIYDRELPRDGSKAGGTLSIFPEESLNERAKAVEMSSRSESGPAESPSS